MPETSFLKDKRKWFEAKQNVSNQRKSQIRKQSIVFLGHIFSSEGTKIDPSETEAIT